MRAVLLVVFSGMTFLLTLILLQTSLGLDMPQMRWALIPLLGVESDQRYAFGRAPNDLLAYVVACVTAGAVGRQFRRLLYQRQT